MLDVGCGDGMLSVDLVRAGVAHVIAIDVDQSVLDRARARHKGLAIEWQRGDINEVQFENADFDAVVSVATLHHLDAAAALQRFAQLVRPSGVVVVVGLADWDWSDIPLEAVALISQRLLGAIYGYWEHSAPIVWPPPLTYGEMKTLSATILPNDKYRRHLLGRYSLVWQRPAQ